MIANHLPKPNFAANEPGSDALSLARQVQELRLELAERDRRIVQLSQDADRARFSAGEQASEQHTAVLTELFRALALPVAQLATQGSLLEQGKPVQARDVYTVARRMIRVLETHGLGWIGEVGGVTPFDPNLHTPLASTIIPAAGQPVRVRVCGITYQGQALSRAQVELVEG